MVTRTVAATRPVLRRAQRTLRRSGLDLRQFVGTLQQVPWFVRQRRNYRRATLATGTRDDFPFGEPYPCLLDHRASAGEATGHYFHQDLFVAQEIFRRAPVRHIDVGSRVDGFVAHVASFRQIETIDIRPLGSAHEAIVPREGDLLSLSEDWTEAADSVSCLHALEHFGLGRYGDACDPNGWEAGLVKLTELVEPGGTLYLSVPIGRQRVEFNAHRVFAVPFFQHHVQLAGLQIESLSIVDDSGDFHRDVDHGGTDAQQSFNFSFGLGIWILRKG